MRSLILLAPLMLAACGVDGNSTITINGEDGNVSIASDAEGRTTIKAPGVDASITLPKINLDAADFDVSGVKLYPGSTVRNFKIDADETQGKDHGRVDLSFDAPASLDKVQTWFRDAMAKRKFKVSPQGQGFAGTTDEGEPITIELNADGADKTKGRMTIGA